MAFPSLSHQREPVDRDEHCVTSPTVRDAIQSSPVALAGKRILITGGTDGIGLETARIALTMGAAVMITGSGPNVLQKAALDLIETGRPIVTVVADASSSRGRSAAIAAASQLLGGIDIIVHCSDTEIVEKLSGRSDDELRSVIADDLSVPLQLAHEALPYLQQSFDPLVVEIDAGNRLRGTAHHAAYTSAAAELFGFHDAWKTKLKQHGVRWLTFYPGDLMSFLGPANAVAAALIVQVVHTLSQ